MEGEGLVYGRVIFRVRRVARMGRVGILGGKIGVLSVCWCHIARLLCCNDQFRQGGPSHDCAVMNDLMGVGGWVVMWVIKVWSRL